MITVRLFTADQKYVADFLIPPFLPGKGPDVLIWGARTFLAGKYAEGREVLSIPRYFECFGYTVVPLGGISPAPGMPPPVVE